MQFIVKALKDLASSTDSQVWAEGIHVEGVKYVTTKAEGRSIYARKVLLPLL
jgi:hypothetical protein